MNKSFHSYVAVTGLILFVTEVLILMASVYLSEVLLFFGTASIFPVLFPELLPQAVAFALVMVASMAILGMYHLEYREDFRNTTLRLMRSLALGFGIIVLVFYWVPDFYFGPAILTIVMLFSMLGIFLTRLIYYRWSNFRQVKNRVLVLGTGRMAKGCSDLAEQRSSSDKFQIVGFVPMPNEVSQVIPSLVVSEPGTLMSLVNRYQINEIVVAVRNRRSEHFSIQELLRCKLDGVRVSDMETFFEREVGQILMGSLQPGWMVFGEGFDQSKLRTSIKRTFDVLASVMLLMLAFPIMLLTAMCIYIEDRAPVIFRQQRVGKNGQRFMVLKFRSMENDAEKGGKPQWACENDPRTTKVGRLIRKLRIDELPQIFNVLKGEMSFVGPRPERPYFVEQLSEQIPYYNIRHTIKPGITGWAQVRYRYGASVEDAVQKLQYDLYYVKNNSLLLDLIILVDTVRVVLFGRGGR